MIRKQTEIWTTKDKRKIRICDMSDSHLSNTIAMLDRKTEVITPYLILEAHRTLNSLNGDMAMLAMEGEIDRLIEYGVDPSTIYPLYDNLVLESQRREELSI